MKYSLGLHLHKNLPIIIPYQFETFLSYQIVYFKAL